MAPALRCNHARTELGFRESGTGWILPGTWIVREDLSLVQFELYQGTGWNPPSPWILKHQLSPCVVDNTTRHVYSCISVQDRVVNSCLHRHVLRTKSIVQALHAPLEKVPPLGLFRSLKTLWPQAYLSGEMDFSGLPRNSLVKSLVVRRNRWEKSLGVGSESLPASGEIAGRFSVDFACKLSGAAALSWAADDD